MRHPDDAALAVFEGQGELFAQPDYRGCAFARASAESHPGDPAAAARAAAATLLDAALARGTAARLSG